MEDNTSKECVPALNGSMTSGSLPDSGWNLCRGDSRTLLIADFATDHRIGRDEKSRMCQQREKLIGQIKKGRYTQHFAQHQGAYGSLSNFDLGAYFTHRGREFVLLGAQPRARRYKLVCQDLGDGRKLKFTVECVESALRDETQARIRRIYARDKERYAKHAVSDVHPLWMLDVDPHAVYPHECFYRAYRYATHLDRILESGIWLVHGECVLAVGCHAWVELPDGLVFDAVFQQFYRLEDWKKHFVGQAWYRFTPEAAFLIFNNMPRTENGLSVYRWDAPLHLPWFQGIPLDIDYDKAWAFIVASGIRDRLPKVVRLKRRHRRG